MRHKTDDLRAELLSASLAAMQGEAPEALQDALLNAVVRLTAARKAGGDLAPEMARAEAALEAWRHFLQGGRQQTG